jgi:exodeoxyribonuclease V alpha subunit
MAKRIVKKFEKDTLDIIEQEVEKLSEVEGIGRKRVAMIKKAWADQRDPPGNALSPISWSQFCLCHQDFQDLREAIEVVQENTYRLATDIFGIGFLTAERIAEKLGFAKDSDRRAEAGILYVLHQLADGGHVYYPCQSLFNKSQEILEVDQEILLSALTSLNANKKVVIDDLQEQAESGSDHRAVYLAKFYLSETNIAARMQALINAPKALRPIDPDKALAWVQKQIDITLAPGRWRPCDAP